MKMNLWTHEKILQWKDPYENWNLANFILSGYFCYQNIIFFIVANGIQFEFFWITEVYFLAWVTIWQRKHYLTIAKCYYSLLVSFEYLFCYFIYAFYYFIKILYVLYVCWKIAGRKYGKTAITVELMDESEEPKRKRPKLDTNDKLTNVTQSISSLSTNESSWIQFSF